MSTINHNATRSFPPPQPQPLSLFKMLGGELIIATVVVEVSRRMVIDTSLKFLVHKQELVAGKDYLVQFFSAALTHGIPSDTSKVDEAIVDQLQRQFNLGLNEQHFDLILGHLVLTLSLSESIDPWSSRSHATLFLYAQPSSMVPSKHGRDRQEQGSR